MHAVIASEQAWYSDEGRSARVRAKQRGERNRPGTGNRSGGKMHEIAVRNQSPIQRKRRLRKHIVRAEWTFHSRPRFPQSARVRALCDGRAFAVGRAVASDPRVRRERLQAVKGEPMNVDRHQTGGNQQQRQGHESGPAPDSSAHGGAICSPGTIHLFQKKVASLARVKQNAGAVFCCRQHPGLRVCSNRARPFPRTTTAIATPTL